MIRMIRRFTPGSVTLMVAAVQAAGPALAGHCTNADKNAAAGVQAVIDAFSGEIVWISDGLQARIDNGVVDLATGAGFHGLLGFDINGDGVSDATTFIVTPNFALPEQAQLSGAPCHGIVSIEVFFTQCLN